MTFLYRITWIILRIFFAIFFRWRVFNAERVPQTGSVILASNHASFIDPPLIGTGLAREINFLARESLFRFPLIGAFFSALHAVPVDRDGGGARGLKKIIERLQSGGGIVLFPEGTRTKDGRLQPAHSGIGLIVVKSIAPVVPVRVFGTFEAYGRKMKFPRPYHVSVKYGVPLNFTKLRAEAIGCDKARLREIYQQIADEIMAAIAKLEAKAD